MPSSDTARHGVSILVIDDDAAISALTRDILGKLGFRNVTVIHDAEEGLRIIGDTAIDLVITDWEMAPLTGIEMTRRLRALDSPKRHIPVIMLTGHGEEKEIEMARDSGITDYLVKPFTAENLGNLLTTVLGRD